MGDQEMAGNATLHMRARRWKMLGGLRRGFGRSQVEVRAHESHLIRHKRRPKRAQTGE